MQSKEFAGSGVSLRLGVGQIMKIGHHFNGLKVKLAMVRQDDGNVKLVTVPPNGDDEALKKSLGDAKLLSELDVLILGWEQGVVCRLIETGSEYIVVEPASGLAGMVYACGGGSRRSPPQA